MKLTSILLVILILLSGCTGFMPKPLVDLVTKEVTHYPNLPNIERPPPITLLPVDFDWPRTNNLVVKNSKACLDVIEKDKNKSFWRRCGINEIDDTSNIYIGLDQKNFESLTINFKRILAREEEWRHRLKSVNNQRQKWREQNQQKESE
jgi:hypothetical protein